MIWIIIAIAFIAIVYLMRRPHKYWIEKGVKQGDPMFLLGDNWGTILKKHTFYDMANIVYNISPTSRYCGIYQFLTPILVLRDLELIKQITVRDFNHFMNHQGHISEDADPLWGKNLFALHGQRWRDMRTVLSPAFTSSKMKYLFSLVLESGDQFVEHFFKQNKEVVTVEMKDTFSRFMTDVIASTAFGVKCDSLEDPNNEFYLKGKEATDFSGFWKVLKFFGFFLFPQLNKFLGVKVYSKNVSDFFTKLIKENIEHREKHGIVRPDILNLLAESRKIGLKYEESLPQDAGFAAVEESDVTKSSTIIKVQLTDLDIAAQAFVFFFGGFETLSSLMSFMAYELGVHPDVQERLIQEIDDVVENCNGKLTYEALMGMKYMDMVVSEALRMWPSNVLTNRVCNKPYTIEPKTPDERPLHLEKDSVIWIPIYAIQRDPTYFPDPDRFDPERFNNENKKKIKPYSYIPFGCGPRNCIGSRMALLTTKALFFQILRNFEIIPVERTPIPLKIDKTSLTIKAEGGFWLGLKHRVK